MFDQERAWLAGRRSRPHPCIPNPASQVSLSIFPRCCLVWCGVCTTKHHMLHCLLLKVKLTSPCSKFDAKRKAGFLTVNSVFQATSALQTNLKETSVTSKGPLLNFFWTMPQFVQHGSGEDRTCRRSCHSPPPLSHHHVACGILGPLGAPGLPTPSSRCPGHSQLLSRPIID